MSERKRKILLSLTPELVTSLDTAAHVLGMCRSDVIRRSLQRDLSYVMSHEVPNMQRFHAETTAAHSRWMRLKDWLG
jgi:metal-responsive CopG/Arc/MetJ family transcriptional regulator